MRGSGEGEGEGVGEGRWWGGEGVEHSWFMPLPSTNTAVPLNGQKLGKSSKALSMPYLCHRSNPRAWEEK